VRVTTLDREVEALRPAEEASTGRSVSLPEVEPWPRPVSGDELLNDLAAVIRRHVVVAAAAADVVAAWALHTWVFERFAHRPRLAVTSPLKRCGKSTLLELLRLLCRRPLKADSISASGVFRTVEALSPVTLLIDEADTFLKDNEELRGVLNSGFERSGEVIRVVEIRDEHRPVKFRTFAPVAIAAIKAIPGTIEDRSIPISMQLRGANEHVEKLRAPGARERLAELASKAARWAADRTAYLNEDPPVPDALGDREGDVSVCLLAIADDAGGAWPERVRGGLITLFGRRAAEDRGIDIGALLLADIKVIFAELSATRRPSSEIVDRLGKMEHRPGSEWNAGRPMSAPRLARALAPFGVRPGTIRTGAGANQRGHYREAFEEAWER